MSDVSGPLPFVKQNRIYFMGFKDPHICTCWEFQSKIQTFLPCQELKESQYPSVYPSQSTLFHLLGSESTSLFKAFFQALFQALSRARKILCLVIGSCEGVRVFERYGQWKCLSLTLINPSPGPDWWLARAAESWPSWLMIRVPEPRD